MPTQIQGNWIIEVVSSNTSIFQRYIITGATSGNGVYSSNITNTNLAPKIVRGTNWNITIQAQSGNDQWSESDIRLTTPTLVNGRLTFFIESDDYFRDGNYTDLVLKLVDADYVPPIVTPPPPPPPVIINPPPVVVPPVVVNPPPVIPPPAPQEIAVGKVYTKLDINDVLPRQVLKTTYGIWLGTDCIPTGSLLTYHTGSHTNDLVQVYQSPTGSCCAEPMFDIVYGNKDGSGSRDLGGNDYYTLSKAIYGQYRNLVGTELKLGSKSINHFYVINVKRDRMGDKLDSGVNEINIHQLSGSQWGVNTTHTGSNVRLGAAGNIIRLIDDSRLDYTTLTSASKTYFYSHLDSDLVHNSNWNYLVSGTLETGVYNPTHPQVYGITYPKLGIFMLDADILNISASFLTVTGSDVAGDNPMKLFKALSGSALYTDASGDSLGFQSRKFKYEYLDRYFIRVKNSEYNFSNNPTWRSGSEGLIIDDFNDGNPEVYMTEIGLYNDNHELIAIGKINKPLPKNYTTEGLFTITLKYEG